MAVASAIPCLFSCSESQYEGFKKADNGLHYRFYTHDESGEKAQKGDGVLFRYVIMNHKNDSVMFDSKNVSRDGSGYTGFDLSRGSTFKGSLEDGIMMMARGDSAEFIFPADSFFLKTMEFNELPPGINSGDKLRALVKVKDIKPKAELDKEREEMMAQRKRAMEEAEQEEGPALEKYIAENKIKTKPEASGIYIIRTKPGKGKSPGATDMVKVNYTGKLIDGTVFDSNEGQPPVEFELNRVIPGWAEALQKMKKGEKATIIIPSEMGYGPRGTPGGPIPPYATLVFDVELVDFSDAAPGGSEESHEH